jgi:hypothetical protein
MWLGTDHPPMLRYDAESKGVNSTPRAEETLAVELQGDTFEVYVTVQCADRITIRGKHLHVSLWLSGVCVSAECIEGADGQRCRFCDRALRIYKYVTANTEWPSDRLSP